MGDCLTARNGQGSGKITDSFSVIRSHPDRHFNKTRGTLGCTLTGLLVASGFPSRCEFDLGGFLVLGLGFGGLSWTFSTPTELFLKEIWGQSQEIEKVHCSQWKPRGPRVAHPGFRSSLPEAMAACRRPSATADDRPHGRDCPPSCLTLGGRCAGGQSCRRAKHNRPHTRERRHAPCVLLL